MDYTKKYHLPQWEKSDRIRMEDFNQMCANIENGLSDTAARLTSHLNIPPYTPGSYTGNGESTRIRLGFRPSFLIISGLGSAEQFGWTGRDFAIVRGDANVPWCSFTSSAFMVYSIDESDANAPNLNQAGRKYDYLAIQ